MGGSVKWRHHLITLMLQPNWYTPKGKFPDKVARRLLSKHVMCFSNQYGNEVLRLYVCLPRGTQFSRASLSAADKKRRSQQETGLQRKNTKFGRVEPAN